MPTTTLNGWSQSAIDTGQAEHALAEWFGEASNHAHVTEFPLRASTWLVVGGRGAGKTRLGAEWVHGLVNGFRPFANHCHGRIALIGETLADVREVMVDGPSGIARIARGKRPRFEATRRRLVWPNGAVALMFSSEDPESLRGPQFEAAWGDELAKWKNVEACFDMLQFGLRLGKMPRQLFTTTPKPLPLLKKLMADRDVLLTRMRTRDNAKNLAATFLKSVEDRYGGTRLGRQELDGELIDDRPDALWTREAIEATRLEAVPQMARIVVAVDPPASARKTSDRCGIVAAGKDVSGGYVVLADATLAAARPQDWARAAVALYHALQADCLVAEVNQGGDMVGAVIAAEDPDVPVRAVRARRGKWLRAEPVSMLYEQGRVRHAGRFPALEDEMCDFGRDGLSNGRSPDRVDALVWAVSELMAGDAAVPRVRVG